MMNMNVDSRRNFMPHRVSYHHRFVFLETLRNFHDPIDNNIQEFSGEEDYCQVLLNRF